MLHYFHIAVFGISYCSRIFFLQKQSFFPKKTEQIFHYHNFDVHHTLKKIKLKNFFRN
jgi:hypothetical protein